MVTAYLSAPVRGKDGDAVDPIIKANNVKEGCILGGVLRRAFPSLDLYVPHEHEEIVNKLWRNGVSSKQILKASCEIVVEKDLLLFYTGDGISEGMQKERDAAKKAGIPIVEFDRLDEKTITLIIQTINDIKERKGNV